ncbi:MAG TPA: uroporphyrinogen-III synthase [Planctomycetota bacterium]|nr:uroporphyrinogen-III synthase [Planctomycetota bacterium]
MKTLEGRRVLVTRPRDQAEALREALEAEGATAVLFPTIDVRPLEDLSALDAAIERLAGFDWIAFASANGVEVFFDRFESANLPASVRVAAVGPATARAIRERGARVDLVASEHRGGRLAEEMPAVRGARVLLPRAARSREELAGGLRRRGAIVVEVPVYETLPAVPDPGGLRELERGVDAATFTSASTVRNFFVLLGDSARGLLEGALVACIGPSTAEEARGLGLPVDVEPEESTVTGLVAALAKRAASGAARGRGGP